MKSRIDRWLFGEYRVSSGGLGLFRIFYVFFVLFVFGLPDFTWIARQPDYLFDPRLFSAAVLFDGFPGVGFFAVLTALAWIGYGLLLAGWHTRKVSVLLPLVVLLGKSFAYAFGKIDHDLFVWILPLIMAISNWGETFSVDRTVHEAKGRPPREPQAWPLALLALLLGWGMFTAAAPKALGGWLDPSTQAAEAHLAFNYHVVGRQALLAPFFHGIESRIFWEVQDVLTIAFELAFAISIVRRSWFRFMLVVTTVFHLTILLMLNIPFIANLAAYAAFLPWTRLAAAAGGSRSFPPAFPRWLPVLTLPVAAGAGLLTLSWNTGGRPPGFELAVLGAAVAVAAGFGLAGLRRRPAGVELGGVSS